MFARWRKTNFKTMNNTKETKKGFWARLFSPKPKCSCGTNIIIEDEQAGWPSCGCDKETSESEPTSYTTTSPAYTPKEVIVLGPGCTKCKETFKVVKRVIDENHLAVNLSKIEDISEIMKYNIMASPAVVVDGVVKIKGHIPSAGEVKQILGI